MLRLKGENCYKRPVPNNVASTHIEKIAIHDLDRKKINLISKLHPLVIDYFSMHLYIVNIS